MKLYRQIGIILLFSFLGQVAAWLLPVSFPGSVLGLLLLLLALRTGLVGERHIAETGSFLTGNMAFFFIPLAVNILSSYHLIREALLPVIVICAVSTFITFGAAYGATSLTQSLLRKRGETP